jgi:hypothetical protein
MYYFIPDATANNGAPLTFDIANQPGWTDFNITSGELTGIPTEMMQAFTRILSSALIMARQMRIFQQMISDITMTSETSSCRRQGTLLASGRSPTQSRCSRIRDGRPQQ